MSRRSQEHDYLSLSESSSMEKGKGLTLKATELRLGLPGSESPERENGSLLKPGAKTKRGFCNPLDVGSGKWVFSGGGSEVDSGKNVLFSPRTPVGSECNGLKTGLGVSALKDGVPKSPKPVHERKPQISAPSAKAQFVGWPPIRSFRKITMASQSAKNDEDEAEGKAGNGCLYVKVSMDGAPYLRKVDLKNYGSYMDLSSALEKMFSCFTIGQCGSQGLRNHDGLNESRLTDLLSGSEYVLTYEDRDGDWMLVGDVPWEMFTDSCKRLRIMKSSDAIGLAPRAMEKSKDRK